MHKRTNGVMLADVILILNYFFKSFLERFHEGQLTLGGNGVVAVFDTRSEMVVGSILHGGPN